MNDLFAVSRFNASTSTSSQTAHHVEALCEASSLCSQLIRKAPALEGIAHRLLSRSMEGIFAVPNPDIVFINTQAADGSLSRSLSLTTGLLHALIHGVAVFEGDDMAVYMHHDSVHPAHRLLHFTMNDVQKIFSELVVSLPVEYKERLVDFWEKTKQNFQRLPGLEGSLIDNHHDVVTELQTMALSNEVDLHHVRGQLDDEEKNRLDNVVHDLSKVGIYALSFVAQEVGTTDFLTSIFVISQSAQPLTTLTPENSVGAVFLHTPATGLEKFGSLTELNDALTARLADPETREFLLRNLLLEDRALLGEDDAVLTRLRPRYHEVDDRLTHYRTLSLRKKQTKDFDRILENAQRTKEDVASFLAKVSGIQCLSSFDEAMQNRSREFTNEAQQNAMPHWLRHANEWKKESYAVFQTECLQRERAVSRALAGLESLEAYALHKIEDYVRQHLGYSVDPARIFITYPIELLLNSGNLSIQKRKSLLEFALEGLSIVEGTPESALEVPEESAHPAWTLQFVEKLLADLDVRYHYRQALLARHRQPDTLKSMVRLRDRALTLSSWAARLQEHITDRGLELVMLVSGDKPKAGYTLSMGGVRLNVENNRLRDLIVFHEKSETDEFYVLYAPGAPGGRDMFEFDSWAKLSDEIGRWLKTSSGFDYLLGQTAKNTSAKVTSFLLSIQRKPIEWSWSSVGFLPIADLNFEDSLSLLVNEKVEGYLADLEILFAVELKENSYAERKKLSHLDAQITEVEKAYIDISDLVSYREYARAEGKRLLSSNRLTVDPETVFVDLKRPQGISVPDFSEYTHLQPLTDFFMQGRSSNNAFHEGAVLHSSIGQDLSALTGAAIVKALEEEIGEHYITLLKDKLLTPDSTGVEGKYFKRRALYAIRLKLQMRRAAQIELIHGRLTREQYNWLSYLIISVSESAEGVDTVNPDPISGSSVNTLHFKRLPVEGVLRFKDFNTTDSDYDLIYTPNAPDGLGFRKVRDIALSMKSAGMTEYYRERVRYKEQSYAQAGVDAINQTSDIRDPLQIVDGVLVGTEIGPADRISNLETLYIEMLERMIVDVDDQNLSGGEVWGGRVYTALKWLGNILLIPFPPAALAWGYLHTLVDLARGIVAYVTGDRATANTFFVYGMIGLWWGLTGVKGGLNNEPALVWSAILQVTGRAGKYSVRQAHRTFTEVLANQSIGHQILLAPTRYGA